jgi:Cu/Zn superoxide dismutase
VLTPLHAVAVVRGDSKVTGTITFEQESESAPTTVTWDISGHDANAQRGMHIHTFGDNTNGCTSAGPHCTWLGDRQTMTCPTLLVVHGRDC